MAGGYKNNANTAVRLYSVQVSTSVYNTPIPMIYGMRRVPLHLINSWDFHVSGGSGKKGKSGKKGGLPTYAANNDYLVGFGSLWHTWGVWRNGNIYSYLINPPNVIHGLYTFQQAIASSAWIPTFNGWTLSSELNTGNNPIDGIFAVSITYQQTATLQNYNGPSEAFSASVEQWLYNEWPATVSFPPGDKSYAWSPGSWHLGKPIRNGGRCAFGIGTDGTQSAFTVTMPASWTPVNSTVTAYYGKSDGSQPVPAGFIGYAQEPQLGEGAALIGANPPLVYPELSGYVAPSQDLGSSGTTPNDNFEVQSTYSLTNNGQCNPADVILDIILSGNIFFPPASLPGSFTPLAYSHGLDFGSDPSRVSVLDGSAEPYPPVTTFPYVTPAPYIVPLLKDPPVYAQPYSGSQVFPVGAYVASGSNYYQATQNVYNVAPPNATYWTLVGAVPTSPSLVNFSSGGINGGPHATVSSAAQNTTAGNTIVVGHRWAGASISDTAGNTYTSLGFQPGNTSQVASEGWQFWYVTNCLGNAANVVTVTLGSGNNTYTAIEVWQIAGGAFLFDTQVKGTGTTGLTLTTNAFNTQYQNEIVLVSATNVQALDTYSAAGGATLDGSSVGSGVAGAEHQIYSGHQVGITQSMTDMHSDQWEIFAVAFGYNNGPFALSDGLTNVRNYCQANGIFMSLVMDSQRPTKDWLTDICALSNCTPVWNGQALDFYTFSEVSTAGGGYVYTAPTASGPLTTIDDRWFIVKGSEAPVQVIQQNQQSVYNQVNITYSDQRGTGIAGWVGTINGNYNQNSVTICDQQHAFTYGTQIGSPLSMEDFIVDANTATLVGWPIMKRQRFEDPYHLRFSLPVNFSLFDPMDLVTLDEPSLYGGNTVTVPQAPLFGTALGVGAQFNNATASSAGFLSPTVAISANQAMGAANIAIVWVVFANNNNTFTPPAGWSLLYYNANGNTLWYKAGPTTAPLSFVGTISAPDLWCATMAFFEFGGFPTYNITKVAINANVATITAANNLAANNFVTLNGLTSATFLNTVFAEVTSASPTQFTINFTHAPYGPTADTGQAVCTVLQQSNEVSGAGPGTPAFINNNVQKGSIFLTLNAFGNSQFGSGFYTAIADNFGNNYGIVDNTSISGPGPNQGVNTVFGFSSSNAQTQVPMPLTAAGTPYPSGFGPEYQDYFGSFGLFRLVPNNVQSVTVTGFANGANDGTFLGVGVIHPGSLAVRNNGVAETHAAQMTYSFMTEPESASGIQLSSAIYAIELPGAFGYTIYTLGGLGASDVRIYSMTEDKEGVWEVEAERYLFGAHSPQAPSVTYATPTPPSTVNDPAGSVNAPYFFQPTPSLAQALGMSTQFPLCVAVSGAATNYGGCTVNVSTDGGNSYQLIGRVIGNPTMGYTYSLDYPSHSSPDTAHTLDVDLTESLGAMQSFTAAQQSALVPIAVISGGPVFCPYEVISYGIVTLNSANKYALSPPILRGELCTSPADHPVGSNFVDLSTTGSIFRYTVPSMSLIGTTLYFKFQTFNVYNSALQELSECTAFAYTVTTPPTCGAIDVNSSLSSNDYEVLVNSVFDGANPLYVEIDGRPD